MRKPGAAADEAKVKLVVFVSGKVNLTNAKCIEEVSTCYKYFFEEILLKEKLFNVHPSQRERSKSTMYRFV